MIDTQKEKLISFDVARRLPALLRDGRPVHVSRIYHYAKHGTRGVKLECIQQPRGLCTSEEAVARFLERLTHPRLPKDKPTPSQQRKAHARAEAILDAAGI